MTEGTSSTKRLAANTVMLYVRTLIIMCIGLFTSRVILDSLGFDDFGIYNVVGGFVGMFSIITNSLVATTQRYITVELAKGETGQPKHIFGVVLAIHIFLLLLLGLILETVGVYLLNTVLTIPPERLYAANWVFQISVLTSLLGLISTPYIGIIVAHERLRAFAFISLQDALLRLAICYALYLSSSDRLILYAALLGLVSVWNQFLYMRYCHRHFPEVKTRWVKDKTLFKSVFGFAGMNFIGSVAHILSTEGVTVVLNIYFGVVLNAARAIASQVQNMAGRFTGDFMTALNPQITKEYAGGDKWKSKALCLRGAKFSYIIVLLVAIPISIRAPQLLTLWLKEYPEFTVEFVRLTFLIMLLGVLSNPLVTMNLAVGKIQAVSLWIGGLRIMVIPILYACFHWFRSPLYAYYVVIAMDFVLLFVRTLILDSKTGMPFTRDMVKGVLLPLLGLSSLSLGASYFINCLFSDNLFGLGGFCIVSCIITGIVILTLGLNKSEKAFAKSKFNLIVNRLK